MLPGRLGCLVERGIDSPSWFHGPDHVSFEHARSAGIAITGYEDSILS